MPNRLAHASSLYLRKHAENPIDWWPWCEESLAKAKAEDKPIFLSIGYSSCHWCTVMEGEAFSNLQIAEYMNQNFVPIKVDREERPDLDSIYMQVLQMMRQQGGWPLNVFLAPDDLVPFYGGTYFPVEPSYNLPGFLQVLQAIRQYYDQDKKKLGDIKQEILSYLQEAAALHSEGQWSEDLLRRGLEVSSRIITPNFGGNSFPMIPYANAALRLKRYGETLGMESFETCQKRGLDLALGGIFDHVAGGFHRYTVDSTWTVPHFEKMLYDNGQIVEYLANLWTAGCQEPALRRAVAKTVAWLTREMMAPEGYFYAAQDADNFTHPEAAEPEEGAFYVWRYQELQALLTPAELTALEAVFLITPGGNFEGQIVLQRRQGVEFNATVEAALSKLFVARYGSEDLETFPPARNSQEAKNGQWLQRIPPVTDTKMIVAWNSLMISGLARAAVAFEEPEYYAIATQAAQFIHDRQWVDDRLYRLNYEGKVEVPAQSEDYAFYIKALLDLRKTSLAIGGETEGEVVTDWLELALKIQEKFDDLLWSIELGGYYNTARDASDHLLVRERSYGDNATPAANGIAVANLVKLALITGDLAYLDRAEQALRTFSPIMAQGPQTCPSLFIGLDWFQNCTLVRTSREQVEWLATLHWPTVVLKPEMNLPEGVVALVCEGLSCLEPATSEKQLLRQLKETGVRRL
jgi:uncharacterized protein YyaL (SSP411 family)